MQCHWLWCCLEKAPRVPGCDILLTAACLGSGGSQCSFQQGAPRELQHHCAATGLLTFLSVYTLNIAAGSKSKDTGSLKKHMSVVNFVVGDSVIVYIASCCPGSVFQFWNGNVMSVCAMDS